MNKLFFLLIPLLFCTSLSSKCCHSVEEKIPKCTVEQGFVFQANYLYWFANEDGLDYVQSAQEVVDFPTFIGASLDLLEPNSKWSNGFQAGIGYIFPQRSQWDLLLNWTYFHSKAKDSITLSNFGTESSMLRPTWLPLLLGTFATSAASKWILNYNILDLSLGRDFFVEKWLSFHPKIGLRGGLIHQTYRANYEGFAADGVTPLPPTSFFAKWSYDAIGFRVGTDLEWHMSQSVSLIGNSFLSLLYGKYKLKELFKGAVVLAPELAETVDIKNDYHRVRPAFESELGLRYQTFFGNMQRKFLLGAYYGFTYWIRQNAMVDQFIVPAGNTAFVTDLPTMGDLQLQGLRIELEFDF